MLTTNEIKPKMKSDTGKNAMITTNQMKKRKESSIKDFPLEEKKTSPIGLRTLPKSMKFDSEHLSETRAKVDRLMKDAKKKSKSEKKK